MAGRIGLEADAERLPPLAETGGERGLVELLDVRPQQAEAALEDARRPGRAARGKRGRHDPAERGPARVDRLRLRAVGEVLHDSGRLAAGDAERVPELELGEPAQLPGRDHGGEDAGD